jgi:hypothetical protein
MNAVIIHTILADPTLPATTNWNRSSRRYFGTKNDRESRHLPPESGGIRMLFCPIPDTTLDADCLGHLARRRITNQL